MNGFIYDDDRTYLILNDGKVDTVANKPEWKEGLAYIKSLYDAGLIDPGAFTQNAEAYKKIGDNADAAAPRRWRWHASGDLRDRRRLKRSMAPTMTPFRRCRDPMPPMPPT